MQITIIGCGNMGKGLAKMLAEKNQLHFYDHHIDKSEELEQKGYGKSYRNIQDALHCSELVILAIKPQNLKEAASLIGKELITDQIFVSLLAGTPIRILKGFFPDLRIVRMMPNLALIFGEGVIGLSSEDKLLQKDKDVLTQLFEVLGKVYWLSESKMDALTSLTGSGPAFFFAMIEAMIEAGIAMGFTAEEAQAMVYQMLHGSLTLLEKSGKSPEELKRQIASPGGTTIAGLKRLEEQALKDTIINAFLSAQERALQLSKEG